MHHKSQQKEVSGSDQVYSGVQQLSMCTQNVNRGLPTLKLEEITSYRNCCQTIFPHREEAQYHHCQLQLPKVCVDNNLQMLPENLLMTDHFKRQEHTNRKQEIEI